jgi:hypothetical protein
VSPLSLLDLPNQVGTRVLQVRSAIDQFGETEGRRQRREAFVVILLLSPAILGLLVTSLPSGRKKG